MTLTILSLSAKEQAVVRARIEERSYPEPNSGCLLWAGAIGTWGYGNIGLRINRVPKTFRVHRVFYELEVGPIPPGLDLDHLCRNRACLEPRHLEPVSRRVNSLRGLAPKVLAFNAGTCTRGHPLTGSNIKMVSGRKNCRECANRRWNEGPGAKRRLATKLAQEARHAG